ncbi:MAG TPA: type IV pilus modification protein PilV [Steroidobacteraceae bacterium]|nr:type IV pilus modification protein PilV [Steroidobacteraceae bacterium]
MQLIQSSRLARPAGASHRRPRCIQQGFSLVEVLVALIVLSVGLLGIARMQSLAMSSTTVASKRSMAAIEASSLAAAMHENRGYWTSSDPSGATITLSGTTYSYAGAANLSAAAGSNCAVPGTPCTPAGVAAYDLANWASILQGLLPNDSAVVACGAVTPVTCTIQISWSENTVNVNKTQVAAAALQNSSYTLYVEP